MQVFIPIKYNSYVNKPPFKTVISNTVVMFSIITPVYNKKYNQRGKYINTDKQKIDNIIIYFILLFDV